jgi:hypothetical protein
LNQYEIACPLPGAALLVLRAWDELQPRCNPALNAAPVSVAAGCRSGNLGREDRGLIHARFAFRPVD